MQDGKVRRTVKLITRWVFYFDLYLVRALLKLRGQPRYRLEGSCESCGKCCEEPSIQVGRVIWFFPWLRRTFLWWQRQVNGFELVRKEREGRTFVFRCTHFDRETRMCDSYDSRPGMCRDYPRALLYQPWPDLFEECTYRPISKDGGRLQRALEEAELDEETREELERRLRLK